jgi:excisionase family DNA binding protein
MSEKLLTLEEAAEYLDIHPGTLYRWARVNRVPAVKMGRIWRFRKENLEGWFNTKTAEVIDFKTEPQTKDIEEKGIAEANMSLDTIKVSLRSRIKQYQKRAQEIKSYLTKYPEQWGKFQEEFNSSLNYIFKQIMDYEKEQVRLGRKRKVQRLKEFFIKKFRKNVFMHGVYGAWTITKPLGYPGDYKIIDDVYLNNPPTTGFDRLFDNYFQMSAIAIAGRNRKEDFKRIITVLAEKKGNENLRIMSLACGSCREIKEIISSDSSSVKHLNFDCFDREEKAITFAKKLLDGSPNINFKKVDLLRLCLSNGTDSKIKEKYDLVYSTGFFDYLSHKMSVRLIRNLKKVLKENGIMAISNVRDKYSNPSVHYMEWAGAWDLVYRSDEEFKKIFLESGFKEEQLHTQYEQQGIMQYIIASNGRERSQK